MRIEFGNEYFADRAGRRSPVAMAIANLINGHAIIIGSSGTGKSWTVRKMIRQGSASSPKTRFHVFDVHGDLEIEGASVVQFSEQAPFGLNPLRVNPNPDFGGVRKCVQNFIRTVNQCTAQLGHKQESVLRNLLEDTFADFGFYVDDPSSWSLNQLDARPLGGSASNRLYLEVALADKDHAKAYGARWDPEKRAWWVHTEKYAGELTKFKPAFIPRRYPTLKDVLEYAKRLHVQRFLGSDQAGIRALNHLNKTARTLQRRLLEMTKESHFSGERAGASEELEKAKEDAIYAYTHYVSNIQTGLELETLLKYDSPDGLKGVIDRLSNLNATGVFKDNSAPFDPNNSVWRYKLNPLESSEKKMMVLFLLQNLFAKAVQRGETSEVHDVIVLDELSTYTSTQDESGDGILGIIAREARKFGLVMWAANQSPQGVPESMLSSVGTKILLGVDELYWNHAVSKLRCDTKLLSFIQPHHTMGIQLKEKGALKQRWWWVSITD